MSRSRRWSHHNGISRASGSRQPDVPTVDADAMRELDYASGATADDTNEAVADSVFDQDATSDGLEAASFVWRAARTDGAVWDTSLAWSRLASQLDEPAAVAASNRTVKRTRTAAMFVAACAAACIAGVMLIKAERLTVAVDVAIPTMIETRAAQRTTVRLPDGSRIVLAPFSRLSYDAQFSTRQREVRLAGLAYFEIAHDSARPFLVQAGGSTTRVLGTRFSVRAYDDERVVRVAVEEGHVALGGDGSRGVTELRRGDVGERAESGAVRVSTLTSARSSTEWTRERLVFDSMLVSEVLAEVGRWYGLQIRVADSTLLRRHLSTTLANDDADRALDVLALALDVHVVRDTHTVILRRIK